MCIPCFFAAFAAEHKFICAFAHIRIFRYVNIYIYPPHPAACAAAKISLARIRFFIAKEGAFIVIYLCKVRTDGPLYHGE